MNNYKKKRNFMQSDKSDKNECCSLVKSTRQAITDVVRGRGERDSTQRAKKRFLAIFGQIGGISVSRASELARISRDTYYRWLREDESFRSKICSIRKNISVIVEDLLMEKVFQGDGSSIRFYLSRRHPDYMSSKKVFFPDKTLEDYFDDGSIVQLVRNSFNYQCLYDR
jgi:hypothetical protein